LEHLAEPEMSTVVGLVKYGHIKRIEPRARGGLKGYLRKFLGIDV
jgi:hypothetical protein